MSTVLETLLETRFEHLKRSALSTDCETFKNLPQLLCGTCDPHKLVSFGGSETFNAFIFTKHDVCMCPNQ